MTVKVYGREGCGNCESAKRILRRAKLDYEYLIVDDHEKELDDKFKGQLARSLPHIIFECDEVVWFNNLESKIKEIKSKG